MGLGEDKNGEDISFLISMNVPRQLAIVCYLLIQAALSTLKGRPFTTLIRLPRPSPLGSEIRT